MNELSLGLRHFLLTRWCIGAIASLALVIAVWFIWQDAVSKATVITFTDDGFFPADIIVPLGGEVRFINKSSSDFWPASNLHPSHEVYSDFDPLKPLPSGKSWKFKFDKEGQWGFHDHLQPLYEGTIRVTSEATNDFAFASTEECFAVEDPKVRIQCWDDYIVTEYEKGGLKQGFAAFSKLYVEDPVFAEDCHGFTHTLGDLAYISYHSGNDLELSKEVAYCTYGFFHGFMESLLHDTGSYDGAREFCDYVHERLEGVTRTVGPCLHGIGHGVTDASDPRYFGNAKMYAEDSLNLCAAVGRTEYEIKICATGVFNALAGMYLTDEYGLELKEEDVYEHCREYEREAFREACYEDFKIIPIFIEDKDFASALKHPTSIPDDLHYQQIATDLVAMMHVYSIQEYDYDFSASACNELDPLYRTHCILGLASGFTLVGIPGTEYNRALAFCGSGSVLAEDVAACYDRVQWESIHRFAPEELDLLCAKIPEELVTFCSEREAFAL